MKLLKELLLLEEKEDWAEIYAKAEDVTGGGLRNADNKPKSYRHRVFKNSDYQLWYFTTEDPDPPIETFVAFYLGKAYCRGPEYEVLIDWKPHTVGPSDWFNIGELQDNLDDKSRSVDDIKDYIEAIMNAATGNPESNWRGKQFLKRLHDDS